MDIAEISAKMGDDGMCSISISGTPGPLLGLVEKVKHDIIRAIDKNEDKEDDK